MDRQERPRGHAGPSRGTSSKGSRKTDRTSEIYNELLEEALRNSPSESSRPLKRRRSQRGEVIVLDDTSSGVEEITSKKGKEVITIETSSNELSDDEDEMDWDTVDLNNAPLSEDVTETQTSPIVHEITLTVPTSSKQTKKRASIASRNALTKQIRLEAHKMHLLCLLGSFRHLNQLLSSPKLSAILRAYVAPATINALNTGPEIAQARRTIAFLGGLHDLVSTWGPNWHETKRGWRRPRWVDPQDLGKIPSYLDMNEAISLDVLLEAAKKRAGSRDVAAWLFTALLRSIGVEARLVCSLQPLQFGFVSEGPRQDFYSVDLPPEPPQMETQETAISQGSENSIPPPPSSRRFMSREPTFPSQRELQNRVYTTPEQYVADTQTYSPNHPFFWSEAWDVASQKWIAVDPVVQGKVNQPSRIEPPLSSAYWDGAMGDNVLSYVVGFDNSGFAKDVTRRYAKAYFSKTWKLRVESQGQENWWRRIMGYMDRLEPLDRDQVEEVDLSNHLLKEPIPKKIDDFKYHPLYVLERHLKRNEMLLPSATPVSALTSGKGMKIKTEKVYKRKDVIQCYTAREWFRRGRIIKEGEQPIKHTAASSSTRHRRAPVSSDEEMEENGEDVSTTALYAESQTELYVPPPVENGIIPKNTYGNIDVYVPSMVPVGAVHVIKPSIAIAAQFAGIDYVDAVTGFEFVRNKASPKINGIIIAKENEEGLLSVWEGMMERVQQEEERLRVKVVLERWRKFIIGMGIRRRLDERHGKIDVEEMVVEEDDDGAGGFLPETSHYDETAPVLDTLPTATDQSIFHDQQPLTVVDETSLASARSVLQQTPDIDNSENLQAPAADPIIEDDDTGGGFIVESDDEKKPSENQDDESEGGGFVQDEDGNASDDFIYDDVDGIL